VGQRDFPERPTALVDELAEIASVETAFHLLQIVKLPRLTWLRPLEQLSRGERYQADLAFCLAFRQEAPQFAPLVLDDFASVLDPGTARAMARSLAAFVRERGPKAEGWRDFPPRLVMLTTDEELLAWLTPDWAIELPAGKLRDFGCTANRLAGSLRARGLPVPHSPEA
jgi:ABC-type ATPase with predicted acetyltransferase domain